MLSWLCVGKYEQYRKKYWEANPANLFLEFFFQVVYAKSVKPLISVHFIVYFYRDNAQLKVIAAE